MENSNTTQETLIKAVKGKQLYEIATEIQPEILNSTDADTMSAMDAVVKDNPQFWDMNFTQLSQNLEFLQKLKEYRLNNPLPANAGTIEILKSVIPNKHVKPNNKLANKITKDIVDDGLFELKVSGNKAKKEVFTKIMLNYDTKKVELYDSNRKYTPYDREVYDGVVTLYAAGNNVVTPAMVYWAMNGLTETEQISDKAVEEVRKSLDKSMRIYTVIDYTDEAKLYNKKVEKTTYEGYLLAATKTTVKINGEEHEAYKILSPILYEYARISGQIVSVPINLLNTRNKVNSTEDVIIIRGYLIRQIEWLKNIKTYRSDNITYQLIYEELGVSKIILEEKSYKEKTFTIRNHVKSILESWKLSKYIQSYEEYKDGKTITGVTIKI